MTDSMTDPHQEAAALAREAGGVSVEALAKAMRQAMYLEPGFRDHPQPDEAYPDLARGVITILAARSAGSGSRVERECVCGHGWADHGLTGGCEAEWGTGDGDVFCPCTHTRPTPPPAVDGTRWDKTKRCEAVVDGLPCHMPPEIHPKVVRNRPEYDHQFLPCHPATPPTPAPVDGTRCGECPHAAHTGDICDTDRPGFVTGCPCRTATPPTPAPAVDGTRCGFRLGCGGRPDDPQHQRPFSGWGSMTAHDFEPNTPPPAVDGTRVVPEWLARKHEYHTEHPRDFDFWCVASCHDDGRCDGECDPDCESCPVECPLCSTPPAPDPDRLRGFTMPDDPVVADALAKVLAAGYVIYAEPPRALLADGERSDG